MERTTATFAAEGKGGRRFTVVALATTLDGTTAGGEGGAVEGEGVVRFETSDGVRLRRLRKGEYRLPSGEVLRSADPAAP